MKDEPTYSRVNDHHTTQVSELTDLVKNLIRNQGGRAQVKACSLCKDDTYPHPTNACPRLVGETEEVNTVGYGNNRPRYDSNYNSYNNSYNLGLKDHPNLRYGNPLYQPNQPSTSHYQQANPPQQNPPHNQNSHHYIGGPQEPPGYPQNPNQNLSIRANQEQRAQKATSSTEDMIASLAQSMTIMQTTMVQNSNETRASIQNLKRQMSQMFTAINRIGA